MGLRSCSQVVEAWSFLFQKTITPIFATDRLSLSPFFSYLQLGKRGLFVCCIYVIFTSDHSSLSPFFCIFSSLWENVTFFTTFLAISPFSVPKKSTRKSSFIFVHPEFHLRRLHLGSFVFVNRNSCQKQHCFCF